MKLCDVKWGKPNVIIKPTQRQYRIKKKDKISHAGLAFC